MTRISKQIEVEYYECGEIACVLVFDIEGEEYPAEPYSWGGSRGTEVELFAELVNVRLGSLNITRDQAVEIWGLAQVNIWETKQAEREHDQYVGMAA